ncbi:hypothetical protein PHYPSEUDO_003714 [Phytophthora pseudosyringae]|uniref:Uncharacterized protein n=1 Tax=Phytophthora pseudosyringae TaxID=221518 RepID=A0A8T1VT42_9STRA|nr:hypothetical protein PHYPSEUDO_003714 [Phytophthora pseudosyringae]
MKSHKMGKQAYNIVHVMSVWAEWSSSFTRSLVMMNGPSSSRAREVVNGSVTAMMIQFSSSAPPTGRDYDTNHEQQVAQDITECAVDGGHVDHVRSEWGTDHAHDRGKDADDEVVLNDLVHGAEARQVPEVADVLTEVGGLGLDGLGLLF